MGNQIITNNHDYKGCNSFADYCNMLVDTIKRLNEKVDILEDAIQKLINKTDE